MRKFAANIAFTGTKYIQNPLIITSNEGEILSVSEINLESKELAGLEFYSGMIVPGLINAHTHLELSIPGQTYQAKNGILDFVQHVIHLRRNANLPDEQSLAKMLRRMRLQGTRAFADIANSLTGFPVKAANKNIASKTFFEFFPLSSEQAEQQVETFTQCKSKFPELDIFPAFHSPYAISMDGLSVIKQYIQKTEFSSLHFRESEFESRLEAEENPLNLFYRKMNVGFQPAFVQPYFTDEQAKLVENVKQLLLVHNIYLLESELLKLIAWADQSLVKLNFVLCPRSNYNITGKLPPLNLLMKYHQNICLGTDSLLSSPNLSLFDEMKFMQNKYPSLRLQDLLKMGSYNASIALGWEEQFGEIAVGKYPGLNLIEMKHLKQDVLHPDAKLKVLI